jgi:hypothetical protein
VEGEGVGHHLPQQEGVGHHLLQQEVVGEGLQVLGEEEGEVVGHHHLGEEEGAGYHHSGEVGLLVQELGEVELEVVSE